MLCSSVYFLKFPSHSKIRNSSLKVQKETKPAFFLCPVDRAPFLYDAAYDNKIVTYYRKLL